MDDIAVAYEEDGGPQPRRPAGRLLSARAWGMYSTMVSSSSWRSDTLTDMFKALPRHCQSAICLHASRSTHRPTAVIWPVCSRIGMASSKPRQPERIAIAGDHCQPAKRLNHSRQQQQQQQQRVIPAARLAEHNAVLAVIPPTTGRPRLAEPVVVCQPSQVPFSAVGGDSVSSRRVRDG